VRLLGGVEAGGSKFVCAVGTGPGDIRAETRIPTTSPDETLAAAVEFFRTQERDHGRIEALGLGSFGPLDLDRASPTFGHITSTPKPGWRGTNLLGRFQQALGVPVEIDTDVNAAALGEWTWGGAQGLETFLYLTVGTGIGGGAMVHGRLLHGRMHPEMGHIRVPHDLRADPFPGVCRFHGDCLEGLASGPAIEARWQRPPPALPDEHPAWSLEAVYLGLALTTFICTLSPQRILLGGGVMGRAVLFPEVRTQVLKTLGGYLEVPPLPGSIEDYIVSPALGPRAGLLGAFALAARR
jgi:fructokinase